MHNSPAQKADEISMECHRTSLATHCPAQKAGEISMECHGTPLATHCPAETLLEMNFLTRLRNRAANQCVYCMRIGACGAILWHKHRVHSLAARAAIDQPLCHLRFFLYSFTQARADVSCSTTAWITLLGIKRTCTLSTCTVTLFFNMVLEKGGERGAGAVSIHRAPN